MGDKIRNIPNKKIGWSKFKHILQRMGIHQTKYEAKTNYGNFYVSHWPIYGAHMWIWWNRYIEFGEVDILITAFFQQNEYSMWLYGD